MPHDISKLQTIKDVAAYWQSCVDRLPQLDDKAVAYDMVRVAGNSRFDTEWYAEGSGDPLFIQIFDLAADLETPVRGKQSREDAWTQLRQALADLKAQTATN